MSAATPMVIAAARALCRDHASVCDVNADDLWTLESEDFKRMASLALDAAAAPRLFDSLETLVDALRTGAGHDFIEAFVRDASAALEEAQPGWNKVDEPTAVQLRNLGRMRDAAPYLLEALQHAIRWHDQITPADVARYRAAEARAIGSAS